MLANERYLVVGLDSCSTVFNHAPLVQMQQLLVFSAKVILKFSRKVQPWLNERKSDLSYPITIG